MWLSPPRSPTIVGSAVETIVESSAAISITSISPVNTTSTLTGRSPVVAPAGAALMIGSRRRGARGLTRPRSYVRDAHGQSSGGRVGRLGRQVGRLRRQVGRLRREVGRLGLQVGRLRRQVGRLGGGSVVW